MNTWNGSAELVMGIVAASERPGKENGDLPQVQDEREKQKEILQTIFDRIPIMINFVGKDGRIKMINQSWERTLGWSLKDLEDTTLDLVAELYPDPECRKRVWKFVAESNGEWVEFKARARNGREIDTAWANIRLSDGTWIGIGQDITDRKRAEEALRESEERFRQLAENIREVFWIGPADLSGALYTSPTYESVWGRSPADMMSFPCFLETIHPDDRGRVADLAQSANKQEFAHEYRIVRPDGSVRWIWDRGFPIRDQTGQVVRYVGIAEDITDRKEAEEKLKSTSERLRALDREEERTRIAREMHDELGSALTSLRWDLEELESTARKSASEPEFARIRDQLQTMLRLTDTTIHAVRRIASELRPSVLDDLGLVEAIESHAQEFQTRTELALHCQRPSEEVILNVEQSTAVFRIFQEALTNIARHANATRVDVAMEERDGEFVITIRDNGRGIREREAVSNLSLGCLGMRERARLVGGKVDISGVEGTGTTVRVRIPISADDTLAQ
jgi:PAS domain S-box-containing protein